MMAAKIIFWVSLGWVLYVYVGYPLMLAAWRLLRRRRVNKSAAQPSVSVILAARNERDTIADKLANCLAQDYPPDRLEVIVSLDGPTDGTDEIVRQHCQSRITVLAGKEHQGKAAAINRAMSIARGDVAVFVDARQRIDRSAIRELVANFSDRTVGAVSGELVILSADPRENGQAVDPASLYWRYEKWLRGMESNVHSSVGATGALYAVRRSLFRPLPEDTILDDVMIPLQAIFAGQRIILESAAKVYDRPVCCAEAEFARKVRTLTGNFQLVSRMPSLLLPWRNPIFVQFVSHKLGRLLVPYCLIGMFVSNLFLWEPIYLGALAAQVIWYGLAVAGALLVRDSRKPAVQSPARVMVTRRYEEGL